MSNLTPQQAEARAKVEALGVDPDAAIDLAELIIGALEELGVGGLQAIMALRVAESTIRLSDGVAADEYAQLDAFLCHGHETVGAQVRAEDN